MSLVDWLAHRPDRCPHGWHIPTQGCVDCGQALAAQGQARTSAAHPDDRAAVDAAIALLAAIGKPFSANDARKLHGVKGGVVGAAFAAARKAGLIEPADGDLLEASTSPGTHGHGVFRWIGTKAAAA